MAKIIIGILALIGYALAYSQASYQITNENLQNHVKFLASDALEGRLTGSKGEQLATEYIATRFKQLGLEPAGDKGSFFQTFDFIAGISLGKNNILTLSNQKSIVKPLRLNKDWRPLSCSDSAVFEGNALVFVGYGITVLPKKEQPGYDSYAHLHVKNKWVLVINDLPEHLSNARRAQLSKYATLRHKVFTAKAHGAIGIIFINRSNVVDELIPLSTQSSLSNAGIVALSVKRKAVEHLLNPHRLKNQKSYKQIKIIGQTDIQKKTQQGRNVLAKLRMSENAQQILVIGAHVDHLGLGQSGGSLAHDNEHGMIHPGADDNASGVASVIELAAQLSTRKSAGLLGGKKDILFAAWSGEELGIIGSSYFVKQYTKARVNQLPHLDAAINLDMIGHLRGHLALQGTGSSADWLKLIKTIEPKQPFALITQNDPYLPTDSTAFYLQGVPTLNLFTGAHDSYHSPRDKADTLNYEGIQQITDFLVDLVEVIESKTLALSYQKVPQSKNRLERQFKIYLGTIPDYASPDVKGVKLSGVAKNSPAEHAGIKQGDVIVELATKTVEDIYDYTFLLNDLQVNKSVTIFVLRDQKKLTLTITPRLRT